jgi:SpoVK/Ycf46/Vps4 family AAA+-type ATPase
VLAQRDRAVAAIATRVERLADWSQLVVPSDLLATLREMVARVRMRERVLADWGFESVASTARGVTALFQGGPGTGKSLVAGVIARELGRPLYRVDLSRVLSKWIGETEKNLGALFDAAEDGEAVLLFDEADALFAKRTEIKSSNDRYANVQVDYLLQRLDEFSGIAILTSNFGGSIDAALRRRMSFRVTFPFPDADARERLWRAHVPATAPIEGTLDLASLAERYELSGGYIRNAALRAAFLAAVDGSALRMDHFERAVQLEYRDACKIGDGGRLE